MRDLRSSALLLALLTLLLGGAYPALVTAIAQGVFPAQATGSLVVRDGRAVGSALIGQEFRAPASFWGRPSATAPVPYAATASGGSNLGPLNPALADRVRVQVGAIRASAPNLKAVPVDLVTASGSGLDPHISPAAAEAQVPRVAQARGRSEDEVRQFVRAQTEGRQWGVLGEPRVNVLRLNLALAGASPVRAPAHEPTPRTTASHD